MCFQVEFDNLKKRAQNRESEQQSSSSERVQQRSGAVCVSARERTRKYTVDNQQITFSYINTRTHARTAHTNTHTHKHNTTRHFGLCRGLIRCAASTAELRSTIACSATSRTELSTRCTTCSRSRLFCIGFCHNTRCIHCLFYDLI